MSVVFLMLCTIIRITGANTAVDNETDLCMDYGEAFDRVFTVPHEAAILNCSLVNKDVFDFANSPYNVTWYNQQTGRQITGEEDLTVIRGTLLWFLNITMQHHGQYLCVVRTPTKCFKQETVVHVDEQYGECSRPRKGLQRVQQLVNDKLRCPFGDYIKGVDSYAIRWYKDCELIQKGPRVSFRKNNLELHLHHVSPNDAGFYTCRMSFTVAGIASEVAETIECEITAPRIKRPQMFEPSGNFIKLAYGSNFKKTCRVFLHGKGTHMVLMNWKLNFENDVTFNTSSRVHQELLIERVVSDGIWLERNLSVSSVNQKDFQTNFTCEASNHYGSATGYITLQPADPDLLLPIGITLTMMALLFIMCVLLYREFKVEFTLLFRDLFRFFYASTDRDGKLYDAYVVYPRLQRETFSEVLELFALNTLPQVLENQYGYRLFILGRDSLPGQAVADVVLEKVNLCRRLLLVYTGSLLCTTESETWLEQQVGLYRALVDNSITVVLLEMEELSDPSILPESLRILRERQGAVQAWKKRRRWRCQWTEKDKEAENPLTSFHLTARFWREVHYHMPVNGKSKRNLKKKNMLLNI